MIEEDGEPLQRLVVRKRAGKTEDRLEIRVLEVLSDAAHEMGEAAALEKDGVGRDLQEQLAAQKSALHGHEQSCSRLGRSHPRSGHGRARGAGGNGHVRG